MIDKCAVIPILVCVFVTIVGPLINFASGPAVTLKSMMEPGLANRLFWPAMAAISVVFAVRNYSHLGRISLPPNIICLLAYLAFAGASALWAFRPELSFIRFAQQVMILTSVVLPAVLAIRTTDMMRGLFLCFALAAILNIFFILDTPSSVVSMQRGYGGYFLDKNALGELSGLACLLALHETVQSGVRRVLGAVVVVIAALLLHLSHAKTAFGLTLLVPFLAGFILITGKVMRISPAIILLSMVVCYAVLSAVSGFNSNRLTEILYGDPTFSGRMFIWEFAKYEIARRPLLGWGYQSFWLVGPDAPSIVDSSGWLKSMPNAHNGYYDTMLEMGYIGFALLVIFIIATLHAIGRVADRDPTRARLVLSLALFIILYNFFETTWMHGVVMWVVFVIVAVEIGRYWQPFPLTRAVSPGPTRAPHVAR